MNSLFIINNFYKGIIFIEDNSGDSERKTEVSINIDGVTLKISKARFLDTTKISIVFDDHEHIYHRTGSYKDKTYFQCHNRNRGIGTGRKCMAKANFDSSTNSISIIGSHNENCNQLTLEINKDFFSQKQEIHQVLSENPNLTVIGALDSLREKNINSTEIEKKQPLQYTQAKKIIREYKEENNINSGN